MTTCQWFLRCKNPATETMSHPVLGADIPICARCADAVERDRRRLR